jgi:hypothetical protein
MELESLKYIWRSLEAPAAAEADRTAMLALLHRRSQGPVAQMRRNLIGEGIFLLVSYIPAIGWFLLEFNGRLTGISWLFAGIAVLLLPYYYAKYRLLTNMQCPTCQVRSNLARQVSTLKRYTRFYLLANTAMIPLAYLLSYIIIRSNLHPGSWPSPWWASPLFWFVLLILFTVAIYYSTAWYINRLYGRYIKKLQELLQEMESE